MTIEARTEFTALTSLDTNNMLSGFEPVDFLLEHKKEVSDIGYPPEWFDAQVRFAKKWASLTGENFADTLLRKTATFRIITNDMPPVDETPSAWAATFESDAGAVDTDKTTAVLYQTYLNQEHSNYQPPAHRFGPFDYDYYADRRTVKMHFENPVRGESPLENSDQLRTDFAHMLEDIKHDHPEAKNFVSCSWIQSTKRYSDLMPSSIQAEDQTSTDMFFGGDSVWGQFVDKSGNVNQRVYDKFLNSLETAETTEQLVDAIPYKVLRREGPIGEWYKMYDIGAK